MSSDFNMAEDGLDLLDFTRRFFENNGAALENNNGMTEILIPEKIHTALGVKEYISLTPDLVQFGNPFLDKIISMAGKDVPLVHIDLKFHYIKTQGFGNLIKEQFEFHKCRHKITGTGETMARYIILICKYTAQSDELKQGLVDFSFNLDTGAFVPGMHELMDSMDKEYRTESAAGYSENEIDKIYDMVNIYGHDVIAVKLDDFIRRMNRRFKRDIRSLDEYYNALGKEMEESLLRTGISPGAVKDRKEKIAMLPRELAAKKEDLLNKYSIKIDFTPVAAMAIATPCIKIFSSLISGQERYDIAMSYNPVTKKADPVVCQSCKISTYSFGICSNMHINCPDCLAMGCDAC